MYWRILVHLVGSTHRDSTLPPTSLDMYAPKPYVFVKFVII